MINDQIVIPTDRYVYYDSEGEIISVSNTNDIEGNYIVLPLEKVMNFLTGKESASSYIVVYDTLVKQHVLKLKYHADETAFRINDDIFKVEKTSEQKPDLTITQDLKNKKWVFNIDRGLKSYLKSQSFAYNKKLQFSVTKKNDPNELYHLMIINFKDLVDNEVVEIPFKYQSEESADDISVYTTKRFETYVYEVKND
jgi:hypothetical protein